MQSLLTTTVVLLSTLSFSCSYPVFGTKRYTRANLIPPHDLSSMAMPIYSPVPQYYDTPQYVPVPPYSSEYYDDGYNNYFYYPQMQRRLQRQDRYQSYGMPTYRGEYKPSTYYYSHGPSYTFSDDQVESTNPMDDLHEEIMQEDERERTHDYYPVGQEQWYENPSKQDAGNQFLRNLLRYNNQINAFNGKPYEYKDDEEFEDDEYEDTEPSDYYDQPVQESYKPYSYANSFNPFTSNNYHSSYQNPNTNTNSNYNKPINKEDEEVEELKSLISQQQEKTNRNAKQARQNNNEQYISSHDWQKDTSAYNAPSVDEYDPEYEDSWINWDKKRSLQPKKMDHPKTTKTSTTTTSTTTTTVKPVTTIIPKVANKHSGQKEVVLPRPASPFRNGLAINSILKASSKEAPHHDKTKPTKGNIYDTIKQIIEMERNLEVSFKNINNNN